MRSVEVNELLAIQELKERISELLRLVEEEGETIEVTSHNKVIARLVPASKIEPTRAQERANRSFWADIDRLAVEIGAHWKDDMSAVDAVRDVRREL
jgi:prevent-host-death family protein